MRIPAVALLLLLPAGCAPAVHSATYLPGSASPRPEQAPVRIYQETRPRCPFEEIGWVRGAPRTRFDSPDEVLEAMRARARRMGGDAIVAFSAGERPEGAVVTGEGAVAVAGVSHGSVFQGTVVRFTQADCTG